MNLVILYPHYFFKGQIYSFTSGQLNYGYKNLVSGSRQIYYKRSTPSTSITFQANVTTINADQRAAQYIYLAGLNLMTSIASVNVAIRGADNSTFTTNVYTGSASGITSANLIGRNSEDYILELSGTHYRDFWELGISTGTSNDMRLRKAYLGQWFYFGVEPDAPASFRANTSSFYRLAAKQFSLQWKGVTNENLRLFIDNILNYYQFNPVVLYARNWTGVLNNERVLHCKINEYSLERVSHNNNKVSLVFEEII